LCGRLQQDYPHIRLVLHSPYQHAGWLTKFMALGVNGFVSKHSGYAQIVAAIHAVHRGELFVCPVIVEQFSNFPEFLANRSIPLKMIYPGFSPREAEVLDLLAQGYSSREISTKLFVSEKTIETHRKSLVEKAGVKNTAELIRFVSVRGLLLD
jgi:DNA-binding NarL/FixJ family response regulator